MKLRDVRTLNNEEKCSSILLRSKLSPHRMRTDQVGRRHMAQTISRKYQPIEERADERCSRLDQDRLRSAESHRLSQLNDDKRRNQDWESAARAEKEHMRTQKERS